MDRELIRGFRLRENNFTFHDCHAFISSGRRILINSRSGSIFVCDQDLLDQIKTGSISDDLQFKLIQRGFATINEDRPFEAPHQVLPQFFIIDFTRACNLRCVYCFRHLEEKVTTISESRLNEIIDYLLAYAAQHNIKDLYIQPWGGEPLLAFDRLRQLNRRLTESGIGFKITLETNACLVTSEMAAELNEMDIGIGVSLDGLPRVHDSQRPAVGGSGSFEKVYRGIQNLWNAGFRNKLGIVTVLTGNNLVHLDDILDFFTGELDIHKFKLNVVKDSPNLENKEICISPNQYAGLQIRLLNKLIEINKNGFQITEFNIRDKLLNLLIRGKTNICLSQGCLGGFKLIGFDQEGGIYPCDLTDFPEFSIGTVRDGDLILLIEKARETNEFFTRKWTPGCDDCPWWFYCRGGCTSSLKYRRGQINGVDPFECAVNRKLYPALLDLIENDPEVLEPLTQSTID